MKDSIRVRTSLGLAGICGAISCALTYLAWARAGLPYNEDGNYFDGLVNYHAQSVLVFSVGALVALLLGLGLVWLAVRARRR